MVPKWEALKHDSCMLDNNGHFFKEDLDNREKELTALGIISGCTYSSTCAYICTYLYEEQHKQIGTL